MDRHLTVSLAILEEWFLNKRRLRSSGQMSHDGSVNVKITTMSMLRKAVLLLVGEKASSL